MYQQTTKLKLPQHVTLLTLDNNKLEEKYLQIDVQDTNW